MTHASIGSWHNNSAGFGFQLVEQDLNKKVVGYYHGINATIVLVDLSFQAACYHSFQGSQLDNYFSDNYFSLVICMALPSTMKSKQ